MLDCVKNRLRELLRNKLRSLLTVGGIVIGVLSVVVISTIGEVGKDTINEQLVSMGMESVVISGDKSNESGLSEQDLKAVKQVPSVENAMPLIYIMSETNILDSVKPCMLWGVNEDADNVIELQPVYGRLINKGDVLSNAKVCIVDEKIAIDNYKRANIVGKTISVSINGRYEDFEVIGVVKNGVNLLQNMLGGIIPNFVYIPYTTMKEETMQTYFDEIAVKVNGSNQMGEISDELSRAIMTNRMVPTELKIENLLKQKKQLNDILGIVTVVLSAIAGISLVVSGLSIMTIMLVSVNERTREIGIKKSIGATNRNIMFEFLIESMLITLMGGILGCILGIGISLLGCAILNLRLSINYLMIGGIVAVSVIIGLIFGVYPAYRASKLKPVDALRYE